VQLSAVGMALFAMMVVSGSPARSQDDLSFSKSQRRIDSHDFIVSVNHAERDGHEAWVARLVQRNHDQPEQTMWANSHSCPAMMPAFSKLQFIEPFKIVPPGVRAGATTIFMDGDNYQIHARGYWAKANRNGEISLSSNDGPIMNWVEDTMKALTPCWGKQRPVS
jgi:hypothetical protein